MSIDLLPKNADCYNVGYEVDVEYDIYSYEDALEIAKQKKLEYPNNRVWIRAEFYADYEEA